MVPFEGRVKKISDLKLIWQRPTDLDEEHLQAIAFQESLLVGVLDQQANCPIPVGAACLCVRVGPQRLSVYARTQLKLVESQSYGGSLISSCIDRCLRTVEEKRSEYVKDCGENRTTGTCRPEGCGMTQLYSCTRSLYINRSSEGWMSARPSTDICDDQHRTAINIPPTVARQLVGEGASFALMRLLALHKYVGQFETTTILLSGDVCKNFYQCMGPESGNVNGKRMDVCRIYRRITEECGLEHLCMTTLTDRGRIVNHEWSGCNYVLYLNPMTEMGDEPFERVDWASDLQLLSIYLDRRRLCADRARSYMRDRPDIRTLLSDYVQAVLQFKPMDVVCFTMEYFHRFAEQGNTEVEATSSNAASPVQTIIP